MAVGAGGRAQLIVDHMASQRFKDSIDKKRLGKRASIEEMTKSRHNSIARSAKCTVLGSGDEINQCSCQLGTCRHICTL